VEKKMQDNFSRLFRHAEWANRRVLALLQNLSAPPEKARRVFAHLLAAEQVWLTRLRGEDSSALEIWPDFSLEKIASPVEKNAAAYRQYLAALTEAKLDSVVNYRNSKGAAFRTSVKDILTHVSMHGSYHRGQIAQTIRGAGFEPVNTDFITFVREGM
jgi:uncharacterized damage-inducible protein DinB